MKIDSLEPSVYLNPLKLAFSKAANKQNAIGMKAYMLNQFEFYGIKTPQRDAIVKSFLKIHRVQHYNELEKIVQYMWSQNEREWQYAAIDVLASHITLWKASTIQFIQYCLTHKSWWDIVDGIGRHQSSKEFFIQKAIGWALREYSKTNPAWVKSFVESQDLAPLSKREALKKITG